MSEQKEARDAAKWQAKLKEQQGVFRASVEVAKDGVIAPAIRDEKTGRWLPGVSPNPGGRGGNRRAKAILETIDATVQPELVADVVLGLLTHPNSWRANAEGVKLYFHYMVGPAPARTPERENVIDVILAKLRANAESE